MLNRKHDLVSEAGAVRAPFATSPGNDGMATCSRLPSHPASVALYSPLEEEHQFTATEGWVEQHSTKQEYGQPSHYCDPSGLLPLHEATPYDPAVAPVHAVFQPLPSSTSAATMAAILPPPSSFVAAAASTPSRLYASAAAFTAPSSAPRYSSSCEPPTAQRTLAPNVYGPAVANGSDNVWQQQMCNTMETLAATLKSLAAATVSSNTPQANLLSRLSTPKDLPDFSGDPMEWLQFKQAYMESTEVCNFTDKENLWRLRKCLKGAAKEAVNALFISATSPHLVMSTLELQFGNPERLIAKITADLQNLPPLPQVYQKDIVKFAVKVRNYVEAVKAVGELEYIRGTSVVNTILSKLPPVLVSKWSDYSYTMIVRDRLPRLLIMADFLQEEATKVSTTASVFISDHELQIDKPEKVQHTLIVQDDDGGEEKCGFCRSATHKLVTKCKQFKKALTKARWQHVKRRKLCFLCLTSTHERSTCTAPVCDKPGCSQQHHRLLHFDIARPRQTKDAEVQSTPENVAHVNENDCKVLLKVVPVSVRGPAGVVNTMALLDDGSTVSLMSSALAERAGLRGRRETLRVAGAWSGNELKCDSTVMNIDLCGRDNKVYGLSVHSVNNLSLPRQHLSKIDSSRFTYLNGIRKELVSYDAKPEILIGQDNHHLMLPLEVKVGRLFEPSATLTPLGWCLHGSVPTQRESNAQRCQFVHATLLVADAVQQDAAAHSYESDFALELGNIEVTPTASKINSLPDGQSAKEVQNIKVIRKSGEFEIFNGTSDSVAELISVPNEVLETAAVKLQVEQLYEGEQTLGLIRYPTEDTLGFDAPAKRTPDEVLQGHEGPSNGMKLLMVMPDYDDLWLLSPFIIQRLIMLEKTWKLRIGCDDEVLQETYDRWSRQVAFVIDVGQVRIRCYLKTHKEVPPDLPSSATPQYEILQLQTYTAIYWCWQIAYLHYTQVSYRDSKCRVVVEPQAIPKEELLPASMMTAKLVDLMSEHKLVLARRYLCDSTSALHVIGSGRKHEEVEAADRNIDELMRAQYRVYVPTKLQESPPVGPHWGGSRRYLGSIKTSLKVLSLLSFPLLIFLLVEEVTSGDAVEKTEGMDPLFHLPLTISFVVVDVIMTIVLLIGAHKKKLHLLKVYMYFEVVFQLLTLCLDLVYFDLREYVENTFYFLFFGLNLYLTYLVYNTVRLIEETDSDVQYMAY